MDGTVESSELVTVPERDNGAAGLDPVVVAALVDLAPDGIMLIDVAGRIAFANRAAGDIFGCPREELVGGVVEEVIPERFRESHKHRRAEFAETPASRPMGVGLDLWGLRKDGSEVAVQVSLSPISAAGVLHTMAVVRETTQHHLSEQAHRVRLVLAEDERIAAELDEIVIERLFRCGMMVQSSIRLTSEPATGRLYEAVDELDQAIRDIRNAVLKRFIDPSVRSSPI